MTVLRWDVPCIAPKGEAAATASVKKIEERYIANV
jgi:hypothetical protein